MSISYSMLYFADKHMMEGSMGSVSKKIIRLFLADVVIILIH